MLLKKAVREECPWNTGQSAFDILRSEWGVYLFFSVAAFFAASVLMTGWPSGLIPFLRYPYEYSGDSLGHLVLNQKLIEGAWIFINNRVGFPFGCNFLDYPTPDIGSLLILKGLGRSFGSSYAAMNLYFLMGFPVTFICSYVFFRILGLFRTLSVAAALLFVFLPYHFQKIPHLFDTWYFVAPVFFYFGFRLFCPRPPSQGRKYRYGVALSAIALFGSAFFGVYYAFFGCLVLFMSAVAGAIKNRSPRRLGVGFIAIAIVVFGVLINVAPNIQYQRTKGDNPEVAKRTPPETEINGLKLVQMLLPRREHRAESLREIPERYNNFPLVGENSTSALGAVGAVGFLLLLCVAGVSMCGVPIDLRLAFFAITATFLFFFATIGGFASLFAMAVSPLLRAWNRISVFIGFAAIASLFLILQLGLVRFLPKTRMRKVMLPLAAGLCLLGLWDQTTPASFLKNDAIRTTFESDHAFITGIERIVPPDAAIYQLPYMGFPETPNVNQLPDYGLLIGFLHSKSLRWSHGGTKGREGDLFFRALAQQPLQKQVEVITKLGFAGIYVDRRGFADHGRKLEARLEQILGAGAQLQSADGNLAFFKIPQPETLVKEGLSPREIMERAGFEGERSLAEGIDFRQASLPDFVKEITGLSSLEPWGRWSDANLGKSVEILLSKPLPASFTLVLRAQAFGPNAGVPVKVLVGDQAETVFFSRDMEEKRIKITTKNPVFKIGIFPSLPTTPARTGFYPEDTRKLGIGFERIWIEIEDSFSSGAFPQVAVSEHR
jgi:phosphoglycerol transferase